MSIWITGDTHARVERLSTEGFPEQKEMTKDDYVIILGDFGLIWNKGHEDNYEKFWLDWLESKSFTTLFLDGNHENYDRLNNDYLVEEWHGDKVQFIRPSVIHLMRGQVYNIQDKTFFVFGGAQSHDISDGILDKDDPDFKRKKRMLDKKLYPSYRILHESWWPEEMPTQEEMNEGIHNLKAHNNKVDYILTHSPCTSLMAMIGGGQGTYEKDPLMEYLQSIKVTVDYKRWLFGHIHINKAFESEKCYVLYEQIVRIE